MNIKSQEKLLNILFESNENPVITTEEDRFHLEDCIQYVSKPGVIVATIKGKSKYGIQHLPIGAVDNFRFMKVMNEDAIMKEEKNNGKSYETIMDEYELEKEKILEQWIGQNAQKCERLQQKYGNRLLGMDIIQNEKKFQPKQDEEENSDEKKENQTEKSEIIQEEDKNKDQELNSASKSIAEFLKTNEEKLFELSDEKIEQLKKKSSNKKFFEKVEEIAEKYVGDKTPEQIDKNTQTQILKELYKIEKDEPNELKDYKPEDFKKDGLQKVYDYQNALNVIQTKKQESEIQNQDKKEGDQTENGKEQVNEGIMSVLGTIFGGLGSIFKFAWSALSLIWAHPMAAGSLLLLFYILKRNKK